MDGSIQKRYDYLPYGEICQKPGLDVANPGKSEYLYGGKELQTFFGIDWYDSGARYQTTDGIFSGIDPLSEQTYRVSPYAYCAGDPVNYVDPEGLAVYRDTEGNVLYRNDWLCFRIWTIYFSRLEFIRR